MQLLLTLLLLACGDKETEDTSALEEVEVDTSEESDTAEEQTEAEDTAE